MTNYERIKEMSVEEMAQFLMICNGSYAIRIGNTCEVICKDAFVKWLMNEYDFCSCGKRKSIPGAAEQSHMLNRFMRQE